MRNKKTFRLLAFWTFAALLLGSCASTKFEGKAVLTGRVCDEKGAGVPNYYVSLGLGKNAVTDISGVFVFRDVSSGNYHLSGGGWGWCPFETDISFLDKKSIVCVQVEKLESLFPKIEALIQGEKYDEAKELVSKSRDYNEKNPLYLFYKNLIIYCAEPDEKRKCALLMSLEKI
ncbi:MAG: carboxypeptidase regulatory-like domain-containing protein [Treponema sp.]|nr:carboxypeptidase regulatory-like domain-containing protein [Treponema sp.]